MVSSLFKNSFSITLKFLVRERVSNVEKEIQNLLDRKGEKIHDDVLTGF